MALIRERRTTGRLPPQLSLRLFLCLRHCIARSLPARLANTAQFFLTSYSAGVTRSPVFSHVSSSLNGLATIRAYGVEAIFERLFDLHQVRVQSVFASRSRFDVPELYRPFSRSWFPLASFVVVCSYILHTPHKCHKFSSLHPASYYSGSSRRCSRLNQDGAGCESDTVNLF